MKIITSKVNRVTSSLFVLVMLAVTLNYSTSLLIAPFVSADANAVLNIPDCDPGQTVAFTGFGESNLAATYKVTASPGTTINNIVTSGGPPFVGGVSVHGSASFFTFEPGSTITCPFNPGEASLTFIINEGVVEAFNQSFTFTVNAANAAPVNTINPPNTPHSDVTGQTIEGVQITCTDDSSEPDLLVSGAHVTGIVYSSPGPMQERATFTVTNSSPTGYVSETTINASCEDDDLSVDSDMFTFAFTDETLPVVSPSTYTLPVEGGDVNITGFDLGEVDREVPVQVIIEIYSVAPGINGIVVDTYETVLDGDGNFDFAFDNITTDEDFTGGTIQGAVTVHVHSASFTINVGNVGGGGFKTCEDGTVVRRSGACPPEEESTAASAGSVVIQDMQGVATETAEGDLESIIVTGTNVGSSEPTTVPVVVVGLEGISSTGVIDGQHHLDNINFVVSAVSSENGIIAQMTATVEEFTLDPGAVAKAIGTMTAPLVINYDRNLGIITVPAGQPITVVWNDISVTVPAQRTFIYVLSQEFTIDLNPLHGAATICSDDVNWMLGVNYQYVPTTYEYLKDTQDVALDFANPFSIGLDSFSPNPPPVRIEFPPDYPYARQDTSSQPAVRVDRVF